MIDQNAPLNHAELAIKITRLVEEKGWNQDDFAKIAELNRQTIRQILRPEGDRRLRNSTIARCAAALGLSVHELRTVPIERLLFRMRHPPALFNGDEQFRKLYEQVTQPELRAWIERNPERARQLTEEEVDELLSLQAPNGALQTFGVEGLISQLERKRTLIRQVKVIANSELASLLEQFVQLLYDKVRPAGEPS